MPAAKGKQKDMAIPQGHYALHLDGAVTRPAASDHPRLFKIDRRLLSVSEGCGRVLALTPRYQPNSVFPDVMRRYGFSSVYADRAAARILDREETLMRQFCFRLDEYGVALRQNFQAIYEPCGMHLAADSDQRAVWFLAEPGNYLALRNYYRDALPAVLSQLGIALRGSVSRLTPAGWQNLFKLATHADFRYNVPPLQGIEIGILDPVAVWRAPILNLGISLLNVVEPEALIEKARTALAAIPRPAFLLRPAHPDLVPSFTTAPETFEPTTETDQTPAPAADDPLHQPRRAGKKADLPGFRLFPPLSTEPLG